ncbi:hypothetical protein KY285_007808 [Solanum tuberosum]|nr:hypothetical protein KY285_007808 [Solanum tuberosum]
MTYYDPYDNDEVRMAKRLGHIPECQVRELLRYWKNSSKKSFALVRNKLEKDKETVSSKDLFVVTRTRKPERLYKASNENTTSKIAEMEEIEKQMSVNGEYVDAFSSVMGPQHPRRLRLYGHAGFIDPNILTALSIPSPRESTSFQGAGKGWCR